MGHADLGRRSMRGGLATIDRCDGTLTVVHRGSVNVYDNQPHKTVTVRAGSSYLARP
jgi:hypothetical protein